MGLQNDMFQITLLSLMVFQNCGVVVLMHYSRIKETGPDIPLFSTASVIVMQELMKLLICIFIIFHQNHYSIAASLKHIKSGSPMKIMISAVVPSILYVFQNTLIYIGISNIEAGMFQILSQLKILITGILLVIILKKVLTKTKWAAIFTLFIGVCIVQLSKTNEPAGDASDKMNPTLGLTASIGAALASGFAGVYMESIMKGVQSKEMENVPQSVWLKNIHLSSWGIAFAYIAANFKDGAQFNEWGFFHGYDSCVWGIVAFQAGGGILVGLILKYLDSILKGFATSISCVMTTIIGIYLFGEEVSMQFWGGAAIVLASVWLYGQPNDYIGNLFSVRKVTASMDLEANKTVEFQKMPVAGAK